MNKKEYEKIIKTFFEKRVKVGMKNKIKMRTFVSSLEGQENFEAILYDMVNQLSRLRRKNKRMIREADKRGYELR